MVRLISLSGVVTGGAGCFASYIDGEKTNAGFNNPRGLAVVPSSGVVVVADSGNMRIRLMTQNGIVTTLAGSGSAISADGKGTSASFLSPVAVAVMPSTEVIVVADGNCIRLVTPAGSVSTLAGSPSAFGYRDTMGLSALFNGPSGVAALPSGDIVVSDLSNNCIRLISPGGSVSTFVGQAAYVLGSFGDGTGTAAHFYYPGGLAVDSASGSIAVSDGTVGSGIRLVSPAGAVTTIAGVYGATTFSDGPGLSATFKYPSGIAFLNSSTLVVADTQNNRVRLVTLQATPPVFPVCDFAWHHVAMTYSPPTSLSAFIDGALFASSSTTITLPARALSTLRIGWSGNQSMALFANIADMRIYSRTLNGIEIAQLAGLSAASAPSPSPSSLPSLAAASASSASATRRSSSSSRGCSLPTIA